MLLGKTSKRNKTSVMEGIRAQPVEFFASPLHFFPKVIVFISGLSRILKDSKSHTSSLDHTLDSSIWRFNRLKMSKIELLDLPPEVVLKSSPSQ